MISLPEPALVNEIRYSGIAVNKMMSENLYTEAQLKQALRDFGEQCAQLVAPKTKRFCDCECCHCGNKDDAQRVAEWDAENAAASAIRALIKEIP